MSSILYYLLCSLLSLGVISGISLMMKVKTAVLGNMISALSLFFGILVTLLYNEILSVWSIFIYMLAGLLIGGALAIRVKMIEMPQMVALLNGVGGLASALVGILTFAGIGVVAGGHPLFVHITAMLTVVIGLVTFTGSIVAAGKLHKMITQKPVIWSAHRLWLLASLVILALVLITTFFAGSSTSLIGLLLATAIVTSSFFGIAFAIRVGGADMPITISLLNSLSGVAGAIAGMAVNDLLLVSVGGIVGASGLLLTQIMCKAMNRDLGQILSGRRSQAAGAKLQDVLVANEASPEQGEGAIQPSLHEGDPVTGEGKNEEKETESPQPLSDPAEVLRSARSVIIVPGYGMAMAQAQNQVRQLTTQLEEKGAVVRYAIHPVAGRMPGHMNVLLAEVDVPYEQLFEMEAINDEFATTDLVVVIGANDVINPAAREAADTPIYGMPVLNVDRGREVFICNYDLNPGYAGVENPLYSRKQGMHLMLGDAKDSLTELLKMLG